MLINAGVLEDRPALVVRLLGGLAGVAVIGRVLTRPASGGTVEPPTQAAWRIYWAAVALESVLLVVGSRLLVAQGHQELTVPWVAIVVGVHFLPFARAFGTPVFGWLGRALIALGGAGAVLAVLVGEAAGAAVAGLLSGVVLLGFALRFR